MNRNDTNLVMRNRKKENKDYYVTPRYVIDALLKRERFEKNILEPCCGDGSISEVLKENRYKVKSFDICDRGYKDSVVQDFLKYNRLCSNIITNPPFSLASEFVLHGLKLVKNKMAIISRLSFLETSKRYNLIFKNNPPYKILVFSKRIDMRGITGKTFGGGITFAWYIYGMLIKIIRLI